ncbi:MAG: N-6 DNA methylase [Tissierellia bacterium]|nr:N-6 DNA methylase [Tissierellia bacterium]
MLSTAYSHLKRLNPSADIRLFGQELMGQSYAIGLAEMLIKGQDASNFRHIDSLKEDAFKDTKMRYVLENPPFGTPWKGANAKTGQEAAVLADHEKGDKSRWPAGLPKGDDAQLLFMQSAINKLDQETGRAAIITNGSPLFNGATSSGESQVRRWMLEEDLIEAIIAMPTDLFYNTSIASYVWVLSRNKRPERLGKIQLINATEIYHPLRKSLGNKRREFTSEDRQKIVELYANFEENDLSQIYANEEFIYKEYTVMEPLQRSYKIDAERIEKLEGSGKLNNFFDPAKFEELLEKVDRGEKLGPSDQRKLKKYQGNQKTYEAIFARLKENLSQKKYLSKEDFEPLLKDLLGDLDLKAADFNKILEGLSQRDKEAHMERDKKGNIIYDPATKDTEIVNVREDIGAYMKREVLPHLPQAKAFFEEKPEAKKPVFKTGAEIPFTRYFYKYQAPRPSEDLAQEFLDLEAQVKKKIKDLFGEV